MTFAWPEYVALAAELAEGATEAAYRSAVSRAYSGVFRLASDRFPAQRRYSQTEGSHLAVIRPLIESPERVKRGIGVRLDNLRRQRVTADYVAEKAVSQAQAREAVQRARNLLFDLIRA